MPMPPRPALSTLALLTVAAACAATDEPDRGAERAPCRADGSCDVGLECWSELCVRPPGADCAAVARRLAAYRVGNYATAEQIAPVVADLTGQCQRVHLSAREGRCLTDAPDEDTLLECPRRLLPELDAKYQARHAPPVDAGPPGLPVDPWAPPGTSAGACDAYVALLERMAVCQAMPVTTRATLRQSITALRQAWRSMPVDQRPALEQACGQGRDAMATALASLRC